jgi:signal recognition particle receptor subunit beta
MDLSSLRTAKLGISEASMSILLTIITIIGFSKVATIIMAATERRQNKVLYDEDDGHLVTFQSKKGGSSTDEREFCLLCGTTNSGKTTVFNALLLFDEQWQKHPMPITVTSMKALEGSIALPDGQSIRVVDFPGHLRLLHGLPRMASMADRILFFLDSTKPVREAATILYLLLTNHRIQNAWKAKSGLHNDYKMPILIACTKADLPRSKNCLRIKLQLKQELERMRKAKLARVDAEQRQELDLQESNADADETDIPLGSPDRNLDLDTCEDLPCQLTFTSVGFLNAINDKKAGESMIQLREFVTCGKLRST